jgi:hypothetical protein
MDFNILNRMEYFSSISFRLVQSNFNFRLSGFLKFFPIQYFVDWNFSNSMLQKKKSIFNLKNNQFLYCHVSLLWYYFFGDFNFLSCWKNMLWMLILYQYWMSWYKRNSVWWKYNVKWRYFWGPPKYLWGKFSLILREFPDFWFLRRTIFFLKIRNVDGEIFEKISVDFLFLQNLKYYYRIYCQINQRIWTNSYFKLVMLAKIWSRIKPDRHQIFLTLEIQLQPPNFSL